MGCWEPPAVCELYSMVLPMPLMGTQACMERKALQKPPARLEREEESRGVLCAMRMAQQHQGVGIGGFAGRLPPGTA